MRKCCGKCNTPVSRRRGSLKKAQSVPDVSIPPPSFSDTLGGAPGYTSLKGRDWWNARRVFKTKEETEREKNTRVCVDTEDLGPVLFTSPSKTLARVTSPRAGTDGATAFPRTPTNDKFELYSLASTDTKEELPADARPVSPANNDGPLSI